MEARLARRRHTIDQILATLRETKVALSKGHPVVQVCRTLDIPERRARRVA
jgi:hypothetical protein